MKHTVRTSVKGLGLHYPDRAGLEENIDELKYKLALASRILAMEELDEGGLNGHVSLKLPNSNDLFLVNPFGFLFDEVTPDNLIMVNKDGRVVEGRYPLHIAGFGIHSCIHEMYPGINCIVHTHSPWGGLFSALGTGIEPIDQNCCIFFENHAIYQDYNGPLIDQEDSENLAKTIGDNNALILKNRGAITCGESIETAVMYMIAMERAFRINVLAKSNGVQGNILPEVARSTREWIANPIVFKIEFNALVRKAENKYPELLAFKP